MTPAEIALRVEQVRAVAGDYQVAHENEDDLHRDVLRAIAAGQCADAAGCAAAALETLAIDFRRCCD